MPLHQQDLLIEWLIEERLHPEQAKNRLWQDFGVKTSLTALGTFWQRYCQPRLLRRSHEAAMGFAEQAGGLGEHWAAPSKALIRQKFFDVMSAPFADPKQLMVFAEMIAALERGELEREKLEFQRAKQTQNNALKTQDLALQREKFEFDAVKQAIAHAAEIKTITGDRTLNSAEQSERVRRLLFPQAFAAPEEAGTTP